MPYSDLLFIGIIGVRCCANRTADTVFAHYSMFNLVAVMLALSRHKALATCTSRQVFVEHTNFGKC